MAASATGDNLSLNPMDVEKNLDETEGGLLKEGVLYCCSNAECAPFRRVHVSAGQDLILRRPFHLLQELHFYISMPPFLSLSSSFAFNC